MCRYIHAKLMYLLYHNITNSQLRICKCTSHYEELPPFTTVTSDGYCHTQHTHGGWIVIQRQSTEYDNSVNFNKTWEDYEEGFGNLEGNFWHGLKTIHCLTQNHPW